MADKTRAGERSIFRGDAEDNDTLAEISRALEKERRAPIAAVDSGFVLPPGGQASNIPAMADLEEELLREFALYDTPRVPELPKVAASVAFATPSAVPPSKGAVAPAVDEDDTMPPMEFGALFRASRPTFDEVREPVATTKRPEPEPPLVFEPEARSLVDVAPEPVAPSPTFKAEPVASHEEPAFAGPVPDLADFDLDLSDEALASEPEIEASFPDPVFAGPVPDIDLEGEPMFAGPVPDLDLDGDAGEGGEPAFAGPVPDLDFDDAPTDAVFSGPVPDLDFDLDGGAAEPVAEPLADLDNALMGELELSLGALDLVPEATSVPSSPFAAWKNDRLAGPLGGDDPVSPDWLSSPKLTPVSIPEPESIAPSSSEDTLLDAELEGVLLDAMEPDEADDAVAQVELAAEVEPAIEVEARNLTLRESPDVSAKPSDALREDAATEAVDHASAAFLDAPVETPVSSDDAISAELENEAETIGAFPFVSKAIEPTEVESPNLSAGPTPVFEAPAKAAEVAPALPDWLQPTRRPASPPIEEPVAAVSDDVAEPEDFDFDFDVDAIEAEVSRAVLSELEVGGPKPSDEPTFDPTQISEIEERIPTSVLSMEVPSVPEHEREAVPQQVSDFDYDIEAEMAELFAMGHKPADLGTTAPAGSHAKMEEEPLDPFDQGLANEIIRSIHETSDVPVGRAFSVGQADAGSSRVVSRYARIAAVAAIVAFAGVGAVLLWRTGDVPGLATDGPPRVILADKTPIKEVPENPGGKQVPNQDKAVYDRVSGKAPEELKQDSLIAKSEEPVNVAEKTLETDPTAAADTLAPGVAGDNAAVDTEARLPASTGADNAAAQTNDAIAPRKVKTMIVLPNGTLVARETPEPSAASALASATAPDAKDVASASQIVPPADAAAGAPTDAAAAADAAAKDAPAIVAPVPVPRPAEQPVNVVGTVTQRGNVVPAQPAQKVAAANPAPTAPAPAAASSVPAGSYVIQIASLPTQEEAQKSYANLSSKFGSVIGGRPVDIKAAEIAGKGTFYRVRIVAGSKDDAIALCTRYRAAGGSCLVSR